MGGGGSGVGGSGEAGEGRARLAEGPGACAACGVRLRDSGVECCECGVRVHGCCTGVSVWRRRGLRNWRCGGCEGGATEMRREEEGESESVRLVEEERLNEPGPRPCGVCRVTMRRGQNGVSCIDCGLLVHKKCCGLSRWARENGESWRCVSCRDGIEPANRVMSPPNVVLPAGKCDICRRMRRRGQGIRCVMCKSILHVKCADLGSRGRAQVVDRSVWECVACMRQKEEREGQQGSDGSVPASVPRVPGSHSVAVMQWNCDHLPLKVPELEVWLRKNDVDVAVLQETKLREEDGELRVNGYEVVRRDRWRRGWSRFSRGGVSYLNP